VWTPARWRQAHAVLDFVRARGKVHPTEVDAEFNHGTSKNWFGGNSKASTQLLDGMHYRGLLRVAGRVNGVRTYSACEAFEAPANPSEIMDQLIDMVVAKYAPLPKASLRQVVMMLHGAVPQWAQHRSQALQRTQLRLAKQTLEGTEWFWPADENPNSKRYAMDQQVRLLAPFDPIVWDRRRFECFWGWAYRFEAYTPAAKRIRGYYALPLLWQSQVIGWANAKLVSGKLDVQMGYVSGKAPTDPRFHTELETEVQRLAVFLGLDTE
jgi:uncharacterized protein